MPDLLVKDISSDLHKRLKEEAAQHHRSMGGEIRSILEAALKPAYKVPDPGPPFKPLFPIDDAWINKAKRAGRA